MGKKVNPFGLAKKLDKRRAPGGRHERRAIEAEAKKQAKRGTNGRL